MIDWESELGQRAWQRVQSEDVLWLTTVSPRGVPQPRPVWFVWDHDAFLIYSTPLAKKLVHIAQHPEVALHFNTDAGGEDIQVFLGTAQIDPAAPPANAQPAYLAKYQADIATLNMDANEYARRFSVAVRVRPWRLRGLEPIPDV